MRSQGSACAAAAFALVASLAVWPAAAQMGPMPVTTAKPLIAKITDFDEFTGRFEASERVALRARVSGYLERIDFDEGELVEAGAPLFSIDSRSYAAAVETAMARLDAAKAEQRRATDDLARGERLERRDNVAASTLDERRAAKEAADAQVAVAEAEAKSAALSVEFTTIKAPIAGRISESLADVGNLVVENGDPLATIVSIDPIYFAFEASETDFLRYMRRFSADQRPSTVEGGPKRRAVVRLADEAAFEREGAIDFIGNEISRDAGTVRIRARFPNEDGFLTPGLFGRIRVASSDPYCALLVPDEAVLSDQASKLLFTADAEGVVAAKPVALGPVHRGFRVARPVFGPDATREEIAALRGRLESAAEDECAEALAEVAEKTGALGPEDAVIVSGLQRARPGGKVIPTEQPLAFAAER